MPLSSSCCDKRHMSSLLGICWDLWVRAGYYSVMLLLHSQTASSLLRGMCWGVLQVLQQAMSLTDMQSEPQNEEASRVLKFFMSTLLNGSMKTPQPLDKMRSLTTVRSPSSH